MNDKSGSRESVDILQDRGTRPIGIIDQREVLGVVAFSKIVDVSVHHFQVIGLLIRDVVGVTLPITRFH